MTAFTDIKTTEIKIGVETPFSVLHINDTDLVMADDRENERKLALARQRSAVFVPPPEIILSEAEAHDGGNAIPIVHTGDLIDFVLEANLERSCKFVGIDNGYYRFDKAQLEALQEGLPQFVTGITTLRRVDIS